MSEKKREKEVERGGERKKEIGTSINLTIKVPLGRVIPKKSCQGRRVGVSVSTVLPLMITPLPPMASNFISCKFPVCCNSPLFV